ncbi:MAG: glycosyltransferase [Bacteroidales bacterium]|nr:glycosyltransferase [Bacteroidales bacterium]HNW73947.1 glycosyltransferase [Bacteroidales bacterium]
MKKILSFTDYYWPGYKAGGTIRAFMNQVDYLKNDFEFFIVTSDTDYTDTSPYPSVISDQWTHPEPNVHIYYVSARERKVTLVYRLLGEQTYDVVYIHLLFGFWFSFLPVLLAKLRRCRRIVIASHGVLGKGALGVKPGRKMFFLRLMRLTGLYRNTVFHSVTDHETVDIKTHIGKGTRIAEARELPRKISQPPRRIPKIENSLNMVTIARISPEKNQLFALELLTKCTRHKIRYDLVGPVYDESYWARCQDLIQSLPSNIGVNYRGSINSEMILNELQKYDIMLLPTTGENFGHTILESFMAGCPVIISDRTPWKNLTEAGIGYDLPLEKPEAFVSALESFAVLDAPAFNIWSEKAYRYARDWCSNPEMLAENINLFNQ